MVKELLEIKIGETHNMSHLIEQGLYDSFITTKSRLKRNGKGEWQSLLSKGVLMVKRTA